MAIIAEAKLDSSVQPGGDASAGASTLEGAQAGDNFVDMLGYESLFVKMETDSEDSSSQASSYDPDGGNDGGEQGESMQLVLIGAKKRGDRKISTMNEDVEVVGGFKTVDIATSSYTFLRFDITLSVNGVLMTSSRVAREILYFLCDRVWEVGETYVSTIHIDDPDFESIQLCARIPDLAYSLGGQPLGALSAMQRHLIASIIRDFSIEEKQEDAEMAGQETEEQNEEREEEGFMVIGSVPRLHPPAFIEADFCSYCHNAFSLTRFRHHCRNCGASVCSVHSSQRRRLVHYGGLYSQRVCDDCCILIDMSKDTQLLFWRKARLSAYFANELKPYFHVTERGLDKVLRLASTTLELVRSSVVSSVPAKVVLESLSLLQTYGMSGATGILLRQDFLEAAETLRSLSGFDEADMGLHEMTTSILYLIALNRGVRGCDPEREHQEHSEEGCTPLSDADLDSALAYAPLGLVAVYMSDEVECQRLAASQGWATIVAELEAVPEVPAFALFASPASAASDHDDEDGAEGGTNTVRNREAVLAIRGTKSLNDIVTDIRCEPVAFPLRVESEHSDDEKDDCRDCDDSKGARNNKASAWMRVSTGDSEGTYACGGMARAAERICEMTVPLLRDLHRKGYTLRIVGHSLGGAVAALLTVLIRSYHQDLYPSLKCYAYSCPNCLDRRTAESLDGTVVSIICRDDIVSRLRPASVRSLVRELTSFKEQALQYLHEDWRDVLSRARQLWAPLRRSAPAPAGASRRSNTPVDAVPVPLDTHSPVAAPTLRESGEDEEWGQSGEDFADLFLPGRVYHIYQHRGRYQVASVPRDFPALRAIQVQSNMLRDHFAKSTFNALAECRTTRVAAESPPAWTPYNVTDSCEACGSAFGWHSTLKGTPAQCREKHNCRHCGKLMCTPCTDAKRTIPKFGFIFPVRICVSCQLSGCYDCSKRDDGRRIV